MGVVTSLQANSTRMIHRLPDMVAESCNCVTSPPLVDHPNLFWNNRVIDCATSGLQKSNSPRLIDCLPVDRPSKLSKLWDDVGPIGLHLACNSHSHSATFIWCGFVGGS
jgi:hypothetical protein